MYYDLLIRPGELSDRRLSIRQKGIARYRLFRSRNVAPDVARTQAVSLTRDIDFPYLSTYVVGREIDLAILYDADGIGA